MGAHETMSMVKATRSLVVDVEVGDCIDVQVPPFPSSGGVVQVRLLSKSGRRARLHVVHPDEIKIDLDGQRAKKSADG